MHFTIDSYEKRNETLSLSNQSYRSWQWCNMYPRKPAFSQLCRFSEGKKQSDRSSLTFKQVKKMHRRLD